MTNLARHEPRRFRGNQKRASIGLEAAAVIYVGAAIELGANGGAKNLVGTDSTYIGIAEEGADNTSGALGAVRTTYVYDGTVLLSVDNNAVAITRANCKPGTAVYASDGNTFTTVSTNNQKIGEVAELPETTVGLTAGPMWIELKGAQAVQ